MNSLKEQFDRLKIKSQTWVCYTLSLIALYPKIIIFILNEFQSLNIRI